MTRVPVLIAGGGPVGLALAIELGMAGIPCTLVERRDGSVTVPKMSGLSIRSMEISRRLGVAGEARTHGWPQDLAGDYIYCTSVAGYELARERFPAWRDNALAFSPERPTGCAQIYYDPILLERARSLPAVTLRHLTSLDSFVQDAGGVRATVTDRTSGRCEEIAADYLVGCDGAGGTVVTALGFGYEGQGIVANSYNIYLRLPDLITRHDKGWGRFFRFADASGAWGEMIGIDGKELWRLSVLERDPALDADAYVRRLAGCELPYEIINVMDWERRERVAQRYRDGRVFIAGDAAHENSPTGGLGLHTGLADAVDLGWKLSAVLHGWGGPGLLDSYEVERKPIALANVRAATTAFNTFASLPVGPEIACNTPAGAAQRRAFADAFERTDRARGPLHTENFRLGYCYEPSPICIPDGSSRPPVEAVKFIAVARPGTRAPHAWLADGRSTLDLFGRGFVLLRFGDAPAADALAAAAHERHVPFEVVEIADPAIAALYERKLVLVRPDGHVAWRADVPAANQLELVDRVRGALPPA